MTDEDLYNIDPNLGGALQNNDVSLPSEIVDIVAKIDGWHDGDDWHWLVLLADGQCAYITGGCDYTGWDCRSHCYAYVEPDMKAAVRQIPEAYRDEMIAQLPEETRRAL